MNIILLFCIFLGITLSGCVQQITINSIGKIIDHGFEAINEETDLEIAERSIASNLKLIEALLKSKPNDEHLLLLASIGYTSYALGFAEDENPERARLLYIRGRDYGLRLLTIRKNFKDILKLNIEDFKLALNKFNKDDIPALFWTASAWGNFINLSLFDPAAVADLPKVEAMMEHVVRVYPTYYYGGGHIFLGTIYGGRPQILGGDLEKSEKHFETCRLLTDGKFLMLWVYIAKTFTVQKQDKELFIACIEKIEKTPINVLPEARLANAIAKKKAKLLKDKVNEYFED